MRIVLLSLLFAVLLVALEKNRRGWSERWLVTLATLRHRQQRFEESSREWLREYNEERPHESLGDMTQGISRNPKTRSLYLWRAVPS
jgi:transposase InsO family protein